MHCADQEVNEFAMPVADAVAEIRRRANDIRLRARVSAFLGHDIPEYFRNGPVLYLARDAATPNFEVLRFIELAQSHGLPIIIGQDTHATFSATNELGYALGVMPIVVRVNNERVAVTEDVQVIDVAEAEGKQLKDIKTLFGEDFISFHNTLLDMIYPNTAAFHGNGPWIDRHHRGDQLEYYKKVLALSLVHGVFFEFYEPCDQQFAVDVFHKAFTFVEHEFGVRPLVCQLQRAEIEQNRTCQAYPSIIYSTVKNSLRS